MVNIDAVLWILVGLPGDLSHLRWRLKLISEAVASWVTSEGLLLRNDPALLFWIRRKYNFFPRKMQQRPESTWCADMQYPAGGSRSKAVITVAVLLRKPEKTRFSNCSFIQCYKNRVSPQAPFSDNPSSAGFVLLWNAAFTLIKNLRHGFFPPRELLRLHAGSSRWQ